MTLIKAKRYKKNYIFQGVKPLDSIEANSLDKIEVNPLGISEVVCFVSIHKQMFQIEQLQLLPKLVYIQLQLK